MGELQCPICGQKLKNINLVWFCENESCRAYDWTMEESAWQELIRTRKALELAKDTLHWYDDNYDSVVTRNTLDEITALEQKD